MVARITGDKSDDPLITVLYGSGHDFGSIGNIFRATGSLQRYAGLMQKKPGTVPMCAGEVYTNPASGERAIVVIGTDETDGKRLVVDLYLRPSGGMVGRHYHPALREQFRVVSGKIAYTLNGEKHFAERGQTIDIPPGVLHDFWNPEPIEALVRIDVQPASRFVEVIRNGFGLAQDGRTDATGKPSLLQIALFAREFDDVIRYDKGPRVIQQLLFMLLTPFAKLNGLKGSYHEYLVRPASEMVPFEDLDRATCLARIS